MTRYQEELGASHITIGYVFYRSGRPADVIATNTDAAAIYQRLVNAQPDVYRFGDVLAKLYSNIAGGHADLGRLDEAVVSERRAVAIWRREAEANPALTSVGNNLVFGLNNLAAELIDDGRPAEALERLAEARRMIQKMLAVDPNSSFSDPSAVQPPHRWERPRPDGQERRRASRSRRLSRSGENESAKILRIRSPSVGWPPAWGRSGGVSSRRVGRSRRSPPAWRRRPFNERIVAAEPTNRSHRDTLAGWETKVAAALLAQGRLAEARTYCDRALNLRQDLGQGRSWKRVLSTRVSGNTV